jgi:hypothetical protein
MTKWERRFLLGDPSALDDLAATVQELTECVQALVTGFEPWEKAALTLVQQMQESYLKAEQALRDGDLLGCCAHVIEGITPRSNAVGLLMRKVLVEEFPLHEMRLFVHPPLRC